MKQRFQQFNRMTWFALCAVPVSICMPYFETWERGDPFTKTGLEHPFAWFNLILVVVLICARFAPKKEAFDIVLICLVLYILALLALNMLNSISFGRPSGDHMSWGFLILFISTIILIIQGFGHAHEKPVK